MNKETLPIISRFDRNLKVLIFFYAMHLLSKQVLTLKISKLIEELDKLLPKDLIDRENYIVGAKRSATIMLNKCYVPIIYEFSKVKYSTFTNKKGQEKVITRPYDIWSMAKGSPNVEDYYGKVKKALNNLNRQEVATHEPNKKPITLWQKTELDIRHESQMEMVKKCKESEEDLFWLSTHPDCSERCEKWQGKLVSMSLPAIDKSLWTGKTINGHRIYSFDAIEEQVDKYGYHNNIINGFNCRHRLVPYSTHKVAPRDYKGVDIKKQRQIESNIRAMERKIRETKRLYYLYKDYDKDLSLKYYKKSKNLIVEWKAYCTNNGYAWHDERIKV